MNGDFYPSLLGLSKADQEELSSLTAEDEFLNKVVEDCAEGWMLRRLAGCDPVAVRRLYLVRATLAAVRYSITHDFNRSVAAAFALTLCERIEQRVWELEQAADQVNQGRNRL